MMAGVTSVCEVCEGKRFDASVLEHHLGGRDISEVLGDVGLARRRPSSARATPPPRRRTRSWNGWLTSGSATSASRWPLTTLSGGERQRLKLATEMAENGGVYVLDEPTTGLHLADVEQLLGLLDPLVDSGKSVIVVEHHQSVMAHADWIIDLGPGAGHDGGQIVFEGTPADLIAARSTVTGEHLADDVAARAQAARRALSRSSGSSPCRRRSSARATTGRCRPAARDPPHGSELRDVADRPALDDPGAEGMPDARGQRPRPHELRWRGRGRGPRPGSCGARRRRAAATGRDRACRGSDWPGAATPDRSARAARRRSPNSS